LNFGKIGTFPQGKVHKSDEGAIRLGVAADYEHGTVVVNFGTPVVWLALPPENARELALTILKNVKKLEKAGPLPAKPS